MRYSLILLLFILVTPLSLTAQEEKPAVAAQARATDRSIKLRWAPNNPTVWYFANKYGFTVERIKIAEGGKILDNPQKIILNNDPFKPAPEKEWVNKMDDNDYIAVAAQAIFGETFELSENYSTDIMQVVNKAKELESRFSFALFSADHSLEAASLSGLYFEDEKIAAGVKYLYRIYTNIPEDIMLVDTASVYIGLDDYKSLPKPIDLNVEFGDHRSLISWNGELMQKIYNSFWVERSDDGRNFERITSQPIVNTFTGDRPRSKMIFRTDSLPENNKTYFYRVIGINAFGDLSPPSDTISGFGIPVFAYSASILSHEVKDEGDVQLIWSFPEDGKKLLKSFSLVRVDQKTKAEEVIQEHIDPFARSVIDMEPRVTNYFVIKSHDIYGRENNSFPYLVQLEDSVPPSAPNNLKAEIDSLGRVFLSWDENRESDLKGYKVYKSNFKSEQYIQVPGPIWETNTYVDTIKLNNLTEKIYYKVRALDNRFNSSEFSNVLELKKPDQIPPVPPVFKGIKLDSLGILLAWIPSGSEDVENHMLYRKSSNDAQWTLIQVFSLDDTVNNYIDEDVDHRIEYSYTILAVDDNGLESSPAVPLSIKWISRNPYPQVTQLFYDIEKESRKLSISWLYEMNDVQAFKIYKSVNNQPLRLFRTISGDINEMIDYYLPKDQKIEYRIVASFKNGDRTRASKALKIKI